jgi:hypothetical protein
MDPSTPVQQISTGQTVDLPLQCEFTMVGGLFPASYERLAEQLPSDRLSPIHIAPRTGVVAFISIEYHRIGEFEPYNEFGVVIPVTCDAAVTAPVAEVVGTALGGYVHYLPVTTEPSVALGTEIWGYPKELADITIQDGGKIRRTTVSINEEPVVRLDVQRAWTRQQQMTVHSYTNHDGELLRTQADLAGPFAVRPFSQQASYRLGEHRRAAELGRLGLRDRPLGRLYASHMRARIHAGEPSRLSSTP